MTSEKQYIVLKSYFLCCRKSLTYMNCLLKPYAKSFVLMTVCCAIAWYVGSHFSPGAMSPDSVSILTQARSGIYLDNHPPLLAFLWRQVEIFVSGPIGLLILNLSFFYGGLYLIFRPYARTCFLSALLLLLIVGLYPPIIGILGAIWADITMAGVFLLALGICATLTGGSLVKQLGPVPPSLIHISSLLLSSCLIFFGIAVRHNAAAAAYPLIVFLLLCSFRKRPGPLVKKLIMTAMVGALSVIILFFAAKQISSGMVRSPSHFWRVAALYDLAGISYHEQTDAFCPGTVKRPAQTTINVLYTPRSVIPLLTGRQVHQLPIGSPELEAPPIEFIDDGAETNQRISRCWFKAITSHPTSYLKHRWAVYQSLITRSPWGLWGAVYDWSIPNELGVPELLPRNSPYFDIIKGLAARNMIFIPILYVCLGLLLFVPALLLGLRTGSSMLMLAAALYASATAHTAGLFFFAASADFRYSHWTITATIIATSILALNGIEFLVRKYRTPSPCTVSPSDQIPTCISGRSLTLSEVQRIK